MSRSQDEALVPDVPLLVLMNHRVYDPNDAANAGWGVDWLGRLDDATLPTWADYEWVKYEPLR